jgi:hypothetical protein
MFCLSLDDLHKKDHTRKNKHHPFKRNGSLLTHVQREIGAWMIEEGGMCMGEFRDAKFFYSVANNSQEAKSLNESEDEQVKNTSIHLHHFLSASTTQENLSHFASRKH